jgi:hypothetical protein
MITSSTLLRVIRQIGLALVVVPYVSGCATMDFLTDRTRDTLDVFTCSVGYGIGAKAQVGPVQVGLLANQDKVGLRGGVVQRWKKSPSQRRDTPPPCAENDWFFGGFNSFMPRDYVVRNRYKHFVAAKYGPLVGPVLPGRNRRLFLLTEIEAVVGVGPSLRLGVNPGEALDLLLGFIDIDLYDDDIGRRQFAVPRTNSSARTESDRGRAIGVSPKAPIKIGGE